MQEATIFKHRQSDKCHNSTDRRIQWRDVGMAAICGEMDFSLEGGSGDKIVESLTTFRYMGRPRDQTDDDWPAVRQNNMRARLVWGRLGTLLWR